jgi:hypothetical protein
MAAQTGSPPPADPEEKSEEQSSRNSRRLVALAAVVLAVVIIVIVYGYVARPGWTGVANKTFRDYLELLIVPAAIAIGVAVINWMQGERQRQADRAQRARELEVQNQHAQDEALQAYLDQMTQLMLDKDNPLRQSNDVQTLARARTLTVLRRLDPGRKRSVGDFLYEADLIKQPPSFTLGARICTSARPI